MSTHNIASTWFTRASEMMEFWAGTAHEKYIQADLDNDDFDKLEHDIMLAEAEASIEEFKPEPNEFLGATDAY